MQNRLFINELQSVSSEGVAKLKFKEGLNIITGASNTGKSYVINCIDYLFGAENPPKDINESKNYSFLLLELEYNLKPFTIKRYLRGENTQVIYLYECAIKNIEKNEYRELGINAKTKESVSSYILNLMQYSDKKILSKIRTNKTKLLSLREILDFIIVNETSIIREVSPIFSDNYEATYKKSLFNFLLTNKDNSNLQEIEDPKITKAKLFAKIEVYNNLIKDASEKIEELAGFKIEDLNEQINSLEGQYEYNTALLNKKTRERSEYIKDVEKLKNLIVESSRLLNKYTLLQEYYTSDIERIDFVEEGSFYLKQLKDYPCPICNNNIDNQDENFNKILVSCEKENEKIKIKIDDLNQIILSEKFNIEKYNKEINELNNKIWNLTIEIDNELAPHSKVLKNRIDNILALQKKIELKIKLRNDITVYTSYRQNCQIALDTYKVNNDTPKIDNKYYTNFANAIKKLLDNWKYKEDCNVIFDSNTYDIEIDGKPRGHLGKGHRALTHAAFSIAIQNYMYDNDFSFPAFVILDSPLLSLKEADYDTEQVSNIIQNAFWRDLSNTNKDRQIIIFDNKEPSEDVKTAANYIKFTGNKNNGRCGFYE